MDSNHAGDLGDAALPTALHRPWDTAWDTVMSSAAGRSGASARLLACGVHREPDAVVCMCAPCPVHVVIWLPVSDMRYWP
jgi:hypothetical protein